MKHQPALWCQRFPLLYVHYYIFCGSYNKFIIPVFLMNLSLCPAHPGESRAYYSVRGVVRAEPGPPPWRWPWMPRP